MINTSINNRSHMEDITNPLQNYIMKFVQITTNDGRVFIGTSPLTQGSLKGSTTL